MRTYWKAESLAYGDRQQPLLLALLRYRLGTDRKRVPSGLVWDKANLISSIGEDGLQYPVLDLDFPHEYIPSSRKGHGHLYLNRGISKTRWIVLMCALRYAGVIEKGFWIWSIRRGGNFVRLPRDVYKDDEQVAASAERRRYGWIFPKRKKK